MLDKPEAIKYEQDNGGIARRKEGPHTMWIRHDLWALSKLAKEKERRSLKSVFNEALWYYFRYRKELEAMAEKEGFFNDDGASNSEMPKAFHS